ncbi:MAG: ABC transporter ATP-binding protein [Eubacteriaceae bacterium]
MSEIIVHNLTKDYGDNKGIFDLSFRINKGEVFGYLGPNGAGKTTTIRQLLGFSNPGKGYCTIDGLNCRKKASIIQKDLGYLPGEIAFFDEMKGIEFLKYMAEMRGLKDFRIMEALIKYFELDPKGKIKKMSKGMKQKIGIVCAFMHNPSTLILDEPTSGLDPLMQSKFINLILHQKEQGKTILMSSHSFEEVEKTCDRVGIIKNGRFVAIETVKALKAAQRKVYAVSFNTVEEAYAFAQEPINVLGIHQYIVNVAVSGNLKNFTTALYRHDVIGLDEVSQNLEEIFMAYYGGKRND